MTHPTWRLYAALFAILFLAIRTPNIIVDINLAINIIMMIAGSI